MIKRAIHEILKQRFGFFPSVGVGDTNWKRTGEFLADSKIDYNRLCQVLLEARVNQEW